MAARQSGMWTVTTLVDNAGAPILKPVSAFDIDKNFSKLVDMYLEDAVEMGNVEHKTVVEEPVYAYREDYRPDGVLAEAAPSSRTTPSTTSATAPAADGK